MEKDSHKIDQKHKNHILREVKNISNNPQAPQHLSILSAECFIVYYLGLDLLSDLI